VTECLDCCLELIVTVEVGWVACRMELFLELGLEGVHDQAALNTRVAGENLLGVYSAQLEGPLGDNNDFVFEIKHVNLWELALILRNRGLGEVCGHVEERI